MTVLSGDNLRGKSREKDLEERTFSPEKAVGGKRKLVFVFCLRVGEVEEKEEKGRRRRFYLERTGLKPQKEEEEGKARDTGGFPREVQNFMCPCLVPGKCLLSSN